MTDEDKRIVKVRVRQRGHWVRNDKGVLVPCEVGELVEITARSFHSNPGRFEMPEMQELRDRQEALASAGDDSGPAGDDAGDLNPVGPQSPAG